MGDELMGRGDDGGEEEGRGRVESAESRDDSLTVGREDSRNGSVQD